MSDPTTADWLAAFAQLDLMPLVELTTPQTVCRLTEHPNERNHMHEPEDGSPGISQEFLDMPDEEKIALGYTRIPDMDGPLGHWRNCWATPGTKLSSVFIPVPGDE